MNILFLESIIEKMSTFLWGWPIIIFIFLSGLAFSFIFSFIQIKKFNQGWKYLFKSSEKSKTKIAEGSISPLQAFINALSASLGNGGLAGMATVLVDGGPGTVFWVFMLGFISMILRFTEVYASLTIKQNDKSLIGPLVYIKNMPFGSFFIYLYSLIMIVYVISGGISMQTNSMGLSIKRAVDVPIYAIGLVFALLVLYIILGGSKRIMKISEYIIPVKVILFFLGIIILFVYHYKNIIPGIKLVWDNAFNIKEFIKGSGIFTMQQAITIGFARALNATEAGVGTASVFFGSSESKDPIKTSIMSMISAYISTNLVCVSLIFGIIISGVPTDRLTSTQLVISAFETVFGSFASFGISFLSLSFGLGVMVAYIFLGVKIWEFLFGKKLLFIYYLMVPLAAFFGTFASISLIWKSMDLLAGSLMVINVLALLFNIPLLRRRYREDYKSIK